MNAKYLFTAFVIAMPIAGAAQGVLDQSFFPAEPNVIYDNFLGNSIGQTFTVGFAGTLTEVDAYIARPASPVVSWQLTRVGSGELLASGTLVHSNAPNAYSFEACLVSVGVSTGDVLAISLSSPDYFTWAGNIGNPYPGGSVISEPLADIGFRTYVIPIPEPAALSLIAVATACGLGRRASYRERRCIGH
jgi:hypothetical protein